MKNYLKQGLPYFRNVGEYGEKQNKALTEAFKEWIQLKGLVCHEHSTILAVPQDNPETTPKEECRYDICVPINRDFKITAPAKSTLLDHTNEAISSLGTISFLS